MLRTQGHLRSLVTRKGIAFLNVCLKADHIGNSPDCLPLRGVKVLLLTFLLLLLLIEIQSCLSPHLIVVSLDSVFVGNLLFLRIFCLVIFGFHLLLQVLDLPQLLPLVPQSLEE